MSDRDSGDEAGYYHGGWSDATAVSAEPHPGYWAAPVTPVPPVPVIAPGQHRPQDRPSAAPQSPERTRYYTSDRPAQQGEPGYGQRPHGEPGYGQWPHGEPGYGQQPHGEPVYGQQPHGGPGFAQQPDGEPDFARGPHGGPGFGQRPHGEPDSGQWQQPGYGQRPHAEPDFGPGLHVEPGYGQRAHGEPDFGRGPQAEPGYGQRAHGERDFGRGPQAEPGYGQRPHGGPEFGRQLHDEPHFGQMPHGAPRNGQMPHGAPRNGQMPHGEPRNGQMPHGAPRNGQAPHDELRNGRRPHGEPGPGMPPQVGGGGPAQWDVQAQRPVPQSPMPHPWEAQPQQSGRDDRPHPHPHSPMPPEWDRSRRQNGQPGWDGQRGSEQPRERDDARGWEQPRERDEPRRRAEPRGWDESGGWDQRPQQQHPQSPRPHPQAPEAWAPQPASPARNGRIPYPPPAPQSPPHPAGPHAPAPARPAGQSRPGQAHPGHGHPGQGHPGHGHPGPARPQQGIPHQGGPQQHPMQQPPVQQRAPQGAPPQARPGGQPPHPANEPARRPRSELVRTPQIPQPRQPADEARPPRPDETFIIEPITMPPSRQAARMALRHSSWKPGILTGLVPFLVVLVFSWWLAQPGHGPLGWALTVLWSWPIISSLVGIYGALNTRVNLKKRRKHLDEAEAFRCNDLLVVVVPTIGRHDTYPALERSVLSYVHHLPSCFPQLRVDIITEEGCEAHDRIKLLGARSPLIRVVTVPKSYTTKNGTRFKARANHYSHELRIAEGEARDDVWVLHMDDDTGVAMDTAIAMAHFIERQRWAGEDARHLAQGILTYPRENAVNMLTWLADAVRPADDIARFAAFTGAGTPLSGLHGELLLVRASIEATIGWDFGPKAIVEDAQLALTFCRRYPGRSSWFQGRCYGASPATVRDFIKQRERWAWGLVGLATNRTIPLRHRLFLAYSVVSWVAGPLQHVAFVLLVGAALGDMNTTPVSLVVLPLWAINMGYTVWMYLEGLKINARVSESGRRRWWEPIAVLCLIPVFSLMEGIGGFLGFIKFIRRAENKFVVIAKPA